LGEGGEFGGHCSEHITLCKIPAQMHACVYKQSHNQAATFCLHTMGLLVKCIIQTLILFILVHHTSKLNYRITVNTGAHGSVVVKALCYKPEGRGIASRWGGFFLIYLILPAALWHWGPLSL
jgi:hypothetical protein